MRFAEIATSGTVGSMDYAHVALDKAYAWLNIHEQWCPGEGRPETCHAMCRKLARLGIYIPSAAGVSSEVPDNQNLVLTHSRLHQSPPAGRVHLAIDPSITCSTTLLR